MTRNSPEPDSGRLPENLNVENAEEDDFQEALTERDLSDEGEIGETHEGVQVNGYELLTTSRQDDNEEDDDTIEFGYSTFDETGFQIRTSSHYRNLVDTPEPTENVDKTASIPLDTHQIETIKSIMSNVTLPVIPSWAHSVSDEQLKQAVKMKSGGQVSSAENWAVFE